MRFLKNNHLPILIIFFTSLIIFPLLFFGDFQQDDFYILSLNDLKFKDAFSKIILQFSNRPIAALIFSLISRFFDSYEYYILFNFLLIILSCNFIIKSFQDYFDTNYIKLIFVFLCIVPIYSYSTIFSPGMQITGNLSVFFWSVSIFFLNKFIKTELLLNLIVSNIILILMFITYESAFPLIAISFFMPILNKKDSKLKLISFFLLFAILFSTFLQKIVLPEIFNQDISRFRSEGFSFRAFLLYMAANTLLFFNIFYIFFQNFFLSLKIIFNSYFLLAQYFLILFFFITLVFINYKKDKDIKAWKKIKKSKIFSIIVMYALLLLFMHAIAKSAMNVYGINNRALVSLSFFIPLLFVFLFKMINKKKYSMFIVLYFFIVISNYLPIQFNNINYISERNKSLRNIIDELNKNSYDEKLFLYLDKGSINELYEYTTFINNNFDFINMIGFKYKKYFNGDNIWGANITENIFCNKSYWNLHYRDRIIERFKKTKSLIFIEKNSNNFTLKNFDDLNNFDYFINNKIICKNTNFYKSYLNEIFNKNSNKDFIINSKFIEKNLDLYIKLNQ